MYTKKVNKLLPQWLESEREDLRMAARMSLAGFNPMYHRHDAVRLNVTLYPAHSLGFETEIKSVWATLGQGKTIWGVADRVDGHYRNHRYYDTLEQVLQNELSMGQYNEIHPELKDGEKFIGNTKKAIQPKFASLKTVRLGEVAYDIYGQRIDDDIHKPFIVHSSELKELDRIQTLKSNQ